MKIVKALCGAALGIAFATGVAMAQSYPSKPIEFICATSPGSTAATWCQLMANLISKPDNLGQPVHVVYKAGGSGNEAAVYMMGKPADGYTLLHANASWSGYMNLPTFSPDPADFELVAKVEKFLYVLATNAKSPYQTFEDLVKAAKENPGTIGVAGNKIGSIHHKHIISLFDAVGAEVNYIPYEGSGDAVKDVLGNHVPVGLGSIGQWAPHVQSGAVRQLVLINEERVDAIPDVPSVRDLGLNYPIHHQWQGVFLRTGTPEEVRERVANAFARAIETEEYKTYLKNSPHVVPAFESNPDKLREEFAAELKDFGEFMKQAGMN